MLSEVITASRIEAGWELPWIVARASYLPNYETSEMEIIVNAQQAVIDADPLTFEGPYTDDLIGDQWRYDSVHFNEVGLIEHANRWDLSIVAMMPNYTNYDEGDDDGDGIRNENDNCSDTPVGEPVYTDGCSDSQIGNEVHYECLGFSNVTHDYNYSLPSQDSFIITAMINNYCNEEIMYPSTHIVNNNSGISTSSDSPNWRYIMGEVNSEFSYYNVTWEITRNISLVPDGTQIFLELHPTRDNCFENCSSNQDYQYDFSMIFGNLNPPANDTNIDDNMENNTENETTNLVENNTGNDTEDNIEEDLHFADSDRDGIEDSEDKCRGYDDSIDSDSDGIPDACDTLATVSVESEESNLALISAFVLGLILMILIGFLTVGIIKK